MKIIKDYVSAKERLKNFTPTAENKKLKAKIFLSYMDYINQGAISHGK